MNISKERREEEIEKISKLIEKKLNAADAEAPRVNLVLQKEIKVLVETRNLIEFGKERNS